jgi:hypothetical protein
MDFVKNAMGGNKEGGASNNNAGGAQSQDYGDKGMILSSTYNSISINVLT